MDLSYSKIEQGVIAPFTPTPSAFAPPRISRIALIGNYLPRRCGIATFTTDIFGAIRSRFPAVDVDIWAMNDGACDYAYPAEVIGTIEQDDPTSYRLAAAAISASKADLVWLQHEFGIFGGEAGSHILKLIDRLSTPIAVTLHTVLSEPDGNQRRVMDALLDRCQVVMVMARQQDKSSSSIISAIREKSASFRMGSLTGLLPPLDR